MDFVVIRYGKRHTERVTNNNYLSFEKDLESIRKYVRNHRHEKYIFEIQKWTFGLAYIIEFYPEIN